MRKTHASMTHQTRVKSACAAMCCRDPRNPLRIPDQAKISLDWAMSARRTAHALVETAQMRRRR